MNSVVIENKLPLVEYMLMFIGNSILTFSYLLLGGFILYVIYTVIVVIVKTIKNYFEIRKFKEDISCELSINNDAIDNYTEVTYIFKNETVDLINKLAYDENLYTEALIEKIVKRYDVSKKLKYTHINEQKDIGTVDAIHIYKVSLKPKSDDNESSKTISKDNK